MEAQGLGRDSTCNQCGKKFQRKAHLLRHQQQHSGDRPYSCKFCAKTFKRSDVLRDHFSRCERRGSSEIPSSLERGRKRHACDECSRLKVKCDNDVPCRKCKEFGRTCVKSRSTGASSPETTTSATTPDIPGSDRNSIGFLLNCPGETDFMREFPKDNTLSPNGKVAEPDFSNLLPQRDISDLASASVPVYNGYVSSLELESFLSNLEFGNFEQQTHNFPMPGDNMIPWTGQQQYMDQAVLEQRAFDIREKLKYTAMTHNPPHAAPPEVLEAIETITANTLTRWIKLYFRHWHKHGPMVHEATFNPCLVALPLLLALSCIGGMYSIETGEDNIVKLLLDTAEAYIYSIPGMSEEYDLPGRPYVRHGENESLEWQRFQLEELQGAYLLCVVQYWTGNPIARIRVRQQRFERIVAIMRHLEMQTVQHPPTPIINSPQTFSAWILRESYIRTATLATMLDNAFGIFNNMAPRFQWSEIDLPFPSADIYFKTATYGDMLAMQTFPVPRMKVRDAFLLLFNGGEGEAGDHLKGLREGKLTASDMQVLIHFLYTHTWQTLFNSPLLSFPPSSTQPHSSSSSHTNTTPPLPSPTAPFLLATRNWKQIWDEIRSASPATEWEKLGFQRTAETYYEAVVAIIEVWDRKGGRVQELGLRGDCEKGRHLKLVLGG